MKFERKVSTSIGVSTGIVLAAIAVILPPAALAAEKEEIAKQTYDGLVLVPDRKIAAAYVDPEADFGAYNKIAILDCQVAFKKNWQRDHKQVGSHISVSSSDMEKIKTAVADLFREVFTEELSKDGGYEIVDVTGDDVLLVRPAIIDLDVTEPDTMSAGRSRSYTTSAGAATLFIELYDSVTGDVLARAADRKSAERMGGYLSYSNRVTNTADAKKMMRGWAKSLRERLDEYHGK